jgi:hypothetical protein
MEKMKLNKTVYQKIGNVGNLTRRNHNSNSQVRIFEQQQRDENNETSTIIMNKLQSILIPESRTLEEKAKE